MSTLADDAVRHYLNLPYGISVTRDGLEDERPWRATVDELPGCEARGATPAEAVEKIPVALAEWVAIAQADGREVPEPRGSRNYSGKLLLRMSKSLHADLAQAAEREEVSLNAYVNLLLATALNSVSAGRTAQARAAQDDEAADPGGAESTLRLRRFLTLALAANVAVAAIVATLAVILLIAA